MAEKWPKLNEELAEVTGALIGDGCLSRFWSKSKERWQYEIAFTGGKDEFSYYNDFVQPAIKKNFGHKGYLYKRKDGYTRYHIKSRKVFRFFESLGIQVGKKDEKLEIPNQLLQDERLAIPCIRGIMDAEGSIYRRYNKKYNKHPKVYNYGVIQFKMKSKEVIEQVKKVLEKTGIKPNKITQNGSCYLTRITRQEEIKKFIERIGFKNSKHNERITRLFDHSF